MVRDTDVLIRTRQIDGSLYIDALDLLHWIKTIKNSVDALRSPNLDRKAGALSILNTFGDWLEERV